MLRVILLLIAFVSMSAPDARAEQRLALVVGVDVYPKLRTPKDPENGQLRRAVADARTMKRTLEALGFEVDLVPNPDRIELIQALDRLREKIRPGDTVFVFYSGHAIALDNANLLLPSDVPPLTAAQRETLRESTIAEARIISVIREREAGLVIVTLDACRNNPIEDYQRKIAQAEGRQFRSAPAMRSIGIEPGERSGVLAIYSAGFGERALDGTPETGENSVFTYVFARRLLERRSLRDIMDDVGDDVEKMAARVTDEETGRPHRQTPAAYVQGAGRRVFLAGPPDAPAPTAAMTAAARAAPEPPAAPTERPAPEADRVAALPPRAPEVDRVAALIAECDRLGSSPYDADRPRGVAGVAFERLDGRLAERACRSALEVAPDHTRVL